MKYCLKGQGQFPSCGLALGTGYSRHLGSTAACPGMWLLQPLVARAKQIRGFKVTQMDNSSREQQLNFQTS